MHKSFVELLVEPTTKVPLQLSEAVEVDGDVVEGVLTGGSRSYRIQKGIPRIVDVADAGQRQTQESFGYKWHQQQTYTSSQMKSLVEAWAVQRYAFSSVDEMRRYFGARRCILDAGCGGGMHTAVWMQPGWRSRPGAQWVGADISTAIDVVRDRLGSIEGTNFVQADLMDLPFRAGTFDTVISEGVLHHTPSTRAALASVANVLAPGGEILFYVYAKKAPLREFADDWIRDRIAPLPPDQAWEALRPLTALGEALAKLEAEIDVPLDIPYLGIKAGRHDVQRLVYWHFLKLFWNKELTFDENNHVNFDWYHPRYSHRQTEAEVRAWCAELGLTIHHFDLQESGMTVRALKQ